MPIETAVPIQALSQEDFYRVDRKVLGVAFDVHNQFGRLMHEALYREEVDVRCQNLGLKVEREIKIRVSYRTFSRDYYIDILINRGAVMELKAVEELTGIHEAQHLNYLYITNTHHGSLINFRTPSVKRRFVSTGLTLEKRRCFHIDLSHWLPLTSACNQLQEWVVALVQDWGSFLDFRLYRDAVTHFLGGQEMVVKRLPVYSGSRLLGRQKLYLLDEETGFEFSATRQGQRGMYVHLERLLVHTKLKGMAWVNINGHAIEFVTIPNPLL